MNSTKRKFFSLMLAGAAATLMTVSSSAANADSTAGKVTTDSTSLYVRSTASLSASKKTSLAKGSYVTLLEKNGSWWHVEYGDGLYGYCYAPYITEDTKSYAAQVATNWENLNVRSGTSASSQILATLPKGETVIVLNTYDGWSKILYNGTKIGYVKAAYLSGAIDTPSSSSRAVSLSVPSYKQYDSRWANKTVGSSGYTMKSIGCTVTALAMTESYRTGKTLTPASMLSKLSFTPGGAVYWPSNYEAYTGKSYLAKIYEQLSEGTPVIIGAKTSSGKAHWVVVNGFKGGELVPSSFTILDPGSTSRTRLSHLFNEYPYFYKLEYSN